MHNLAEYQSPGFNTDLVVYISTFDKAIKLALTLPLLS